MDCFDFFTCYNPYLLEDWVKINEDLWGVKSERVRYSFSESNSSYIEGVLYLNKRGRVVLPPGNAFLPFRFVCSGKQHPSVMYSHWTLNSKLLAEDISRRGYTGSIVFPPGFVDGRAFEWLGIQTKVKYTFIGELPYNYSLLDASVKKNIKKAQSRGYYIKETNQLIEVYDCLRNTAKEKKFDLYFDEKDMAFYFSGLQKYMKIHAAYTSEGHMAASQIKLVMPNGMCIDWLAGSYREFKSDGVNQLLYSESLKDLAQSGGRLFDFCGANIENVANAKSKWGFHFVPYLVVPEKNGPLYLRKHIKKFIPSTLLYKIKKNYRYRY